MKRHYNYKHNNSGVVTSLLLQEAVRVMDTREARACRETSHPRTFVTDDGTRVVKGTRLATEGTDIKGIDKGYRVRYRLKVVVLIDGARRLRNGGLSYQLCNKKSWLA